jgi:glutathione S-transferase
MMRFFWGAGTVSLASHIALEEAGADYEAVRVDVRGSEQTRPEYLAINPKGRIPALVTDRGVLTETVAILAYVAQTHPQADLAPAEPWAFAQAQAFNAYLTSTVHVAHAHMRRGYRWADEESSYEDMRRRVPGNMADCFRLIETELFQGPWVLGAGFSICDGYLLTVGQWLAGDNVDIALFPRLADHAERTKARPAVGRVLAQVAA